MKRKEPILLVALLSLILFFCLNTSADAQTQTITLKPGFNFVSFTNAITLTPAQYKQLNTAAVDDIFLFSSTAGSFLSLSEGTLATLSAGKGYIIKNGSTSNATIATNGNALSTINNITLKSGFNLVGFSKVPAASTKFSQLMSAYSIIRAIYRWSTTAGSFIQVNNSNGVPTLLDGIDPEFKAGESYFINVSADTYINYDGASILVGASPQTVDAPILTPASGTFTSSCQITITCSTPGAIIRYTLDNNTPNSASTLYSGPISVSQTTTVKALATKSGLADSPVVSSQYVINQASGVITFLSGRDSGISEIYTVNPDGSTLTRVVQTDNHNGAPMISPDGTKIVFSASQANTASLYGGAKINVINTDGTNLKQIYYSDGTNAVDPSYSADGKKIVFVHRVNSSESRISIIDADGKNLTDIYKVPSIGNGSLQAPKFSPDGTKIIFIYSDSFSSKSELYVMNADGSARTLLSDKATNARFSFNGKIYYCDYGNTVNKGIIKCNADGSSPEIAVPYVKIWGSNYLTTAAACPFDISPDAKNIVFLKNYEMYIIKSDGSNDAKQITTIANAASVCWGQGLSGFNGRTPVELKLCSDTGTLYTPPTQISGSLEKVLINAIYPLLNIKVIADFSNDVLINGAYQKMSQWIDPIWTVVSGAGKISGDIYMYFTAPITTDDTIVKATYTEAGKEVSAQFKFSAISFTESGKIYFSSNKDGYYEIYRADYNGANVTKLTNHMAYSINPSVSPDGSKIAYVSGSSSQNFDDREIYVMNSDGTGVLRLTNNSVSNYSPSFSPDGKTICYGEDGKIKVIGVGGGDSKIITGDLNVSNGHPLFTPSGTQIIFDSSHKQYSWYVSDGNFVINLDGSSKKLICSTALSNPCITPDGKIAYVNANKLYTMNIDGTGITPIIPSIDADNAVFSPDGNFVMYEQVKNGVADLWAMASNGTGEKIRVTYANLGILHQGGIAWGK